MTKVRRLVAVAAVLAFTAISTSSMIWGGPAGKKNRGINLDPQGRDPARHDPDVGFEKKLAQAKFDKGGAIAYRTRQNEVLVALQAKHNLKADRARPRDILVLVNTSASMVGMPLIAARQIAEEVVTAARPDDRVSLWTLNLSGMANKFTRDLTKGFQSCRDDAKVFKKAFQELKDEYAAGGTDLKTGLERAIASFENRRGRQQVIIFLGNGRSLEPVSTAQRTRLCKDMVEKEITFFSVPLGDHLTPDNLHGFPTGTGGSVVRVQLHANVSTAINSLQEAMAGLVLYPTTFRVQGMKEYFPTQLPPLRADAPTLVVGRMAGQAKKVAYTIEGKVAGKEIAPITISENVPESGLDNYFLIGLLDQWKNAKEQPALIRANRALVFAFEQNRLAREEALALAQMALTDNELEAAKAMFKKARTIDPNNVEAEAGLKIVANMQNGKLNRRQLLEELKKADRQGLRIDKKSGKVRLTRGQLEQLVALGDNQRPNRNNVDPLDREDLLKAQADRRRVEEQRTTEAIDAALRRARLILATDPEGAHDLLKRTLALVRNHPDLGDRVRGNLANRLENALRDVDMQGVQIRQRRDEQLRIRAQAEELYQARVERTAVQERTRAMVRVYRDLMNHARFEEATAQAQLIREDAVNAGQPVPLAAQAGYDIGLTSTHLKELRELRRRREAGFLQTMMQVERSAIPLPDEPPVHFPPAAKWRELTRLHKHFESSGFSDQDEKVRAKALALQKKLNQPITLEKAIDPNTPLKDALEYFSDHYNITILIDTAAFKDEKGDDAAAGDVEATPVKLPKMSNIALGTALRLLLSQVPPNGATFLIRRDFLEVTTGRRAVAEKALRVYPVADLVIPIPNSVNQMQLQNQLTIFGTAQFNGFTGVGLGGGLGGLGGFGGLGGGLGGLGGGLGGLGGGLGGLGGGLAGLGGGLAGLGGGLAGLGGGLAGLGGGLAGIGGGIGGFGGGIGGIGGLAGMGGGIGGLGGGLGGLGGFGGGQAGQLGQFGNLGGQFGIQGQNQSGQLILLVREVIGQPEDWAPLGLLNRNLPPRLPGGGLPVDEEKDKERENYGNQLGFFSPAMALVVKGTSLIHTNLGQGVFGAKKPDKDANLGINREGALVIRPKMNREKKGDNGEVVVGNDARDRKGKGKVAMTTKKRKELDARKIWEDALARGVNDPRLIIAVADFLAQVNKMDHAAEFLKANLRQGIVARPWVYDALALALETNGGSPDEIRRAQLSAVELEPEDAKNFLKAAKVMAEHQEWKRALSFCQQAAQIQPKVPYAYEAALAYAEKDKNVQGMEWAAGNLLREDWPVDNLKLQVTAQAKLDALATTLQHSKLASAAAQMKQKVESLKERDLVIYLTWAAGESGPADLDLEVKEPTGSLCTCLQRLTPGGGTLIGDTLTESNRETYVAAEGYSGDYEVTVRRIWGRPLGSRAKLVIIKHQGTPDESREELVIRFDRTHTLKVHLDNGRRTTLASVPPPAAYQRSSTETTERNDQVMIKLRDLANPENGNTSMSGGSGSFGGTASRGKPARLNRNQPEEMAYQTRVSPFLPNTIDMTAQAVVSADRRYVRLSLNASFNVFTGLGPGQLVNIPMIPGGFPVP